MDTYKELALRALEIMKMQQNPDENLERMLLRIKLAVPLAASSTELAIMSLTRKIATAIENQDEVEYIKSLLSQLDNEVSFLPFD